jgi:hypothetical protein
MAGATQWKAACPHIDGSPRDVCFHSAISPSNVSNWEPERLAADVDPVDLNAVLRHVEDEQTVAVCNSCRRINVIKSGGVDVLHSGDPHFNDRVGEWLVELSETDTGRSFQLGGER